MQPGCTGSLVTPLNHLTNPLSMRKLLIFMNNFDFEPIKEDLLGKILKVIGRSSKNEMFDRLEFVVQLVFPDPDPDQELKKLEEEAKVIE